MHEETKNSREPYSVERIEKEIRAIEAVLVEAWEHVQALCHITGQDTSKHPIGPKATEGDSDTPIIRIFDGLNNLKQFAKSYHVQLDRLAHDLHPNWYEAKKEKA